MSWIVEQKYHVWAITGFIVLSAFGVILRYLQLFSLPPLDYTFLLHAHSHFAFAGWIFLALALLIVHPIKDKQQQQRFRWIFLLTLVCSYGMLIFFSIQGYKAASIIFSTLFIIVNYLFAWFVWRNEELKNSFNKQAFKLIKTSLVFLCLSSLGPFALGPLMATGQKGTALYQNAIYFYLHFQMNGWMLFAVLGLLANNYLPGKDIKGLDRWINLFIGSTVPVFLIFTLWTRPPALLYLLALIATFTGLLSWLILVLKLRTLNLPFLPKIALLALTVKILFQILVCHPAIGTWVFSQRNLIIGYVHLLTLAVIMPVILDDFVRKNYLKNCRGTELIMKAFMASVVIYLVLLFLQPLLLVYRIYLPGYGLMLLTVTIALLTIGGLFLRQVVFQKTGQVYYPETTPEISMS